MNKPITQTCDYCSQKATHSIEMEGYHEDESGNAVTDEMDKWTEYLCDDCDDERNG